jgi:hypothetical protein
LLSFDHDGDGVIEWKEYAAGSDPFDPASCLKIDSIAVTGSSIRLRWKSENKHRYKIQEMFNPNERGSFVVSGIIATPPINQYELPLKGEKGSFRLFWMTKVFMPV